jgi:signal transduction histidine kinase
MRVELPELLSVLSHELRGPLGILQGYLRLMQRQRPAGEADAPILAAMLEATGRLTAIGRQADQIRAWCGPQRHDVAIDVPARDLAEASAGASGGLLGPTGGARTCDAPVRVFDRDAVAAALAALALRVSREHGGADVALDVTTASDHVTFTLLPGPGDTTAGTPVTVGFDGGGQGLSLVLASYVLDGHGATASPAHPPGAVQVRFIRGGTFA